MFPSQWREVLQKFVGNLLCLAQRGNRAVEIPRVPKDDRGDEEIQPGSPVLLVLVGAIADLPEPVNEYGARQAVAYLERAAIMYTLIQTAKLTDVDPQAWLADMDCRHAAEPAPRTPSMELEDRSPLARRLTAALTGGLLFGDIIFGKPTTIWAGHLQR